MHAARLELDAQAVSERGGKCTRERCPTGRVKSAHSPQMSREVTFGHKSRDDRLIEPGISRMQSAARMGEAFDKRQAHSVARHIIDIPRIAAAYLSSHQSSRRLLLKRLSIIIVEPLT